METPPDGAAAEPAAAPAEDPLPADPVGEAVAAEREEVRRLVEAGASSPEELRALAERMREQRERESQMWAREVKPTLVKARKGRFDLSYLRKERPEDDDDGAQRNFLIIAGTVVIVVFVLLSASNPSFLFLAVPVVAFLFYAWRLGSRPPADEIPAPEVHGEDSPT